MNSLALLTPKNSIICKLSLSENDPYYELIKLGILNWINELTHNILYIIPDQIWNYISDFLYFRDNLALFSTCKQFNILYNKLLNEIKGIKQVFKFLFKTMSEKNKLIIESYNIKIKTIISTHDISYRLYKTQYGDGYSILMWATFSGNIEIVKYIIEYIKKKKNNNLIRYINLQNWSGNHTALHETRRLGNNSLEISQYLLENGANPNIQDIYGKSFVS